MIRRTKIIATLGPASQAPEVLKALIEAGASVFRLNMSHASPQWCRDVAQRVRAAAAELGENVALLMDLKGPTIRTGDIEKPVELRRGDVVEFRLQDVAPQHPISVSVNYPDLHRDLKAGGLVLVDNGVLEMHVRTISPERIICDVASEGILGSRRHINLPGVRVSLPPLAEQDFRDLDLAAELDVEYVAMSFVRDASHLHVVRAEMQKRSHRAEIIAKFEDQQALQHRDEIIEACDAVMVARGDLGIEAHLEELPIIQRRLVKECVRRGRLVIVATHMLESMIENPVPTRAEVTDVAQAVLEQADAIMLSGETSTGQHPVRCVQMMDRIARRIEQEIDTSAAEHQLVRDDKHRVVRAAAALADSFDDASLLVFTQRGVMGRYAAQCRPVSAPIYAFSASAAVCRRLALHRGVLAFPLEFEQGNSTQAIDLALEKLRQSRRVAPGQTLVITSDILHEQGATDAILVRKV